jgi:putative sterol carrier protein
MINHGELEIKEGLVETPNLKITADSRTWLDFLAKETKIVWALIRFKIRIRGDPRLLLAFGKCFPS